MTFDIEASPFEIKVQEIVNLLKGQNYDFSKQVLERALNTIFYIAIIPND